MAFPPTPLQTREEQKRKLRDGMRDYIYIITISRPGRKYGYQTDRKIWVPVCAPMPYCPIITPTKPDPRQEGQLLLLLGLLEAEKSGYEFAPHLLLRLDIKYIAQHAKVYEWPNVPPDDILCGTCYAVISHKLGDLMPSGCDACGAALFSFLDPDEPEIHAPCINKQIRRRTFYPV
jgi:hypothetical protein